MDGTLDVYQARYSNNLDYVFYANERHYVGEGESERPYQHFISSAAAIEFRKEVSDDIVVDTDHAGGKYVTIIHSFEKGLPITLVKFSTRQTKCMVQFNEALLLRVNVDDLKKSHGTLNSDLMNIKIEFAKFEEILGVSAESSEMLNCKVDVVEKLLLAKTSSVSLKSIKDTYPVVIDLIVQENKDLIVEKSRKYFKIREFESIFLRKGDSVELNLRNRCILAILTKETIANGGTLSAVNCKTHTISAGIFNDYRDEGTLAVTPAHICSFYNNYKNRQNELDEILKARYDFISLEEEMEIKLQFKEQLGSKNIASVTARATLFAISENLPFLNGKRTRPEMYAQSLAQWFKDFWGFIQTQDLTDEVKSAFDFTAIKGLTQTTGSVVPFVGTFYNRKEGTSRTRGSDFYHLSDDTSQDIARERKIKLLLNLQALIPGIPIELIADRIEYDPIIGLDLDYDYRCEEFRAGNVPRTVNSVARYLRCTYEETGTEDEWVFFSDIYLATTNTEVFTGDSLTKSTIGKIGKAIFGKDICFEKRILGNKNYRYKLRLRG